ncbi:hypothetical protein LYNGBM3L_02230 [Moorena producens 3L]|uniref:Uncharacterized protein n=1 Tax=Moorena producens 3L TaxID=489825 RepID=F4XRK1_9CYAN|nr:hypothetical protein LYNGBM3L_02230 [Moorena producens 3L]
MITLPTLPYLWAIGKLREQLLNKTGKQKFNLSKVTALVACAKKLFAQGEPLADG